MSARVPLLLLAAAAAAFGIYARFDGIATWPVAVDEYYILRSVQNVLNHGIPLYDCGGLYTRGVVYQYITAGLQLGGAGPELAGRLVTAITSLLTLPAAYLIGKQLHSRAVGIVVAVMLAVSVWEVEIARFARMYAPFQAVFAWYVVFFLRYTLEGERRALWAMVALSILGVLTWEGGVFLAALNLLPPFLRTPSGHFRRNDGVYLAAMVLLLVPIYWFATTDLRMSGTGEELPPDYVPGARSPDSAGIAPWRTLDDYPAGLIGVIFPVGAALLALPWLWAMRSRWLVAGGLALALLLALLHQFAATALILVLLLLTGAMRWQELRSRGGARFIVALLVAAAFWMAFGLFTEAWKDPGSGLPHVVALAYELVRFPDFVEEIVRPWGGAMPVLSLVLAVTIGASIVRAIWRPENTSGVERTLLVILLVMAAAAAASDPPRHETRYIYFLYPLMLLIATTAIVRGVHGLLARGAHARSATAVGLCAAIVAFALTEDFNLSHLRRIDSADVNFRLGASGRERSHLLVRTDVRGAAQWLRDNVQAGEVAINAYPSVDFYYPDFDYTYIDADSSRFRAYACRRGTRERWGNLPLIYDASVIGSQLASGTLVRVVASTREAPELLRELEPWPPRLAWQSIDGEIAIYEFEPGKHEAGLRAVRPHTSQNR